MTHTTRRQLLDQAQGMADHEGRVMVVATDATGTYIRAAADLDVDVTATDWMTNYGLTRLAVLPPTGSFNGYSAQATLAEVLA